MKNKDIESNRFTILQLLNEANREEFELDKLEELMNQDVSISYKLLNYLNSAYFNRLQPISSIKQAIAFLGARGLRQFISLVAIGQMAEGKPGELIRTSIIRARFLELSGNDIGRDSGEMFMLGLFSLIDAMLDNSMENLLSKMPLNDRICEALAQRRGVLYPYLHLIESYETGNWREFETSLQAVGLNDEKVVEFYLDAVGWADSF